MKLGRSSILIAVAGVIAFGGVAMAATPSTTPTPAPSTAPASGKTITQTVVDTATFSTLERAVTAAGLATTLAGAGPFTVLAPTDAAFAKVPASQLNALLGNQAQLATVLRGHVIQGRLTAADLRGRTSVTTLGGTTIPVSVSGNAVKVGTATVTQADIAASNGVIHAIDTVLLPGSGAGTLPSTGGSGLSEPPIN